MNAKFWVEFRECFERIAEHADARAVVVSGAGAAMTAAVCYDSVPFLFCSISLGRCNRRFGIRVRAATMTTFILLGVPGIAFVDAPTKPCNVLPTVLYDIRAELVRSKILLFEPRVYPVVPYVSSVASSRDASSTLSIQRLTPRHARNQAQSPEKELVCHEEAPTTSTIDDPRVRPVVSTVHAAR